MKRRLTVGSRKLFIVVTAYIEQGLEGSPLCREDYNMITDTDEYIPEDRGVYSHYVGESYYKSEERRETTVRIDDADVQITENLWEDTDNEYDTHYKWAVTARLEVTDQCGTKEEVMTSAVSNVRAVKALGALGYDLYSMEEPGVSIWEKAAPDREP